MPRGKVAYGDGVLEFLAENSFKVLADAEIVRKETKRKAKPVAPEVPATPVVATVAATPEPAKAVASKKKKSSKKSAT